jgi:hypothetical protein
MLQKAGQNEPVLAQISPQAVRMPKNNRADSQQDTGFVCAICCFPFSIQLAMMLFLIYDRIIFDE